MATLNLLFTNFIDLAMEASPWLLLGLLIAGLMKAWLPSKLLSDHLGQGKSAIIKAALIGAPLPLCSCGVIPVATELRRNGASKSATASFLVATPETGVDSVTVSYALLGPVFAIFRPLAAIISAIVTGLIVATDKSTDHIPQNKMSTSCCSSNKNNNEQNAQPENIKNKTIEGIHYAATKLIDDLAKWLMIGLLFATLVKTFIATEFLLQYGQGLPAMLMVIAISIPMYICATASTPIAAGLILAGISPGTALVFMMAGPATNISTLGIIKKEMGTSTLIRYLLSISVCSIAFGYLLDWLINYFAIDITQQMSHSHQLIPTSITITCTLLLFFLAIKPLRQVFIKPFH